jgi:hypothetical protein
MLARIALIGWAFLIPKLNGIETVFLSVLPLLVVPKALNPGLSGIPLAALMNEHFFAIRNATDNVVAFEFPLHVLSPAGARRSSKPAGSPRSAKTASR